MKKQPPLLLCVIMDLIGFATYALPGFGELGDVIWAPVSAVIFFFMFGGWRGAFAGVFNLAEELLPGMDFIPTFTIVWLWQHVTRNKKMPASKLHNKKFAQEQVSFIS